MSILLGKGTNKNVNNALSFQGQTAKTSICERLPILLREAGPLFEPIVYAHRVTRRNQATNTINSALKAFKSFACFSVSEVSIYPLDCLRSEHLYKATQSQRKGKSRTV